MRIYRIEHSALTYNGYPMGPFNPCRLSDAINFLAGEYISCDKCGCCDGWCNSDCVGSPHCFAWVLGAITFPTPTEDNISRLKDDEFCACRSISELREWFSDWAHSLDKLGYVIAEYEVSEGLRHGGKQCVFRMQYAQRITDYPVIDKLTE